MNFEKICTLSSFISNRQEPKSSVDLKWKCKKIIKYVLDKFDCMSERLLPHWSIEPKYQNGYHKRRTKKDDV